MRRSTLALLPLVLACGAESPPASVPAPTTATAVVPAASALPPAATTVRRTLLSFRKPFGYSVESTAADGTVTLSYELHENGRGPHCDATLRLAPDGTLASWDAHGHHELGQPVEETFTLEAGHARWKSREEQGERDVSGPAFFVPTADCRTPRAMLVSAALRAGGKIPLLPTGEARVEKAGDTNVQAGGTSKHLTAYALSGLEVEPDLVWMQDDGSFFGFFEPWLSLVPEGWESVADAVIAKSQDIHRARDASLAKSLGHTPPAAGVAFTHARVLDVEHGRWLPDQTVVVVGHTIQRVGPAKTTPVPAGAETVDLAGKALLPGLWDMHSHLAPGDGVLDIASGVTTARDVGNSTDRLDDFKQRFDAQTAIGPHVLRAGLVEGRGDQAASADVTATTPEEARDAVAFFAGRGYQQIKIYNSVKPELVPIITKEAHARGMTVTGHIPWHMLAHEAVDAGYDGIEHINQLLLNFFADHDTDTRTPLRFSLVGDRAADLDLHGKPMQDFVAQLRKHHTVVDPTYVTFEPLYVGKQGQVPAGQKRYVDRLPIQLQRSFLQGGLPMEGKEELYAKSWQKMLAVAHVLHDAGVPVVVGTDYEAGLSVYRELELFVQAGFSAADALRAATLEPARLMKLDAKTGSIAAGKEADLYVVDGDPLANIGDVSRASQTMCRGVLYASKDTYAAVGVAAP